VSTATENGRSGAAPGARPISTAAAALPLLTLLAAVAACGLLFELRAEMLIVALLAAATVAGVQAVRRGATWETIQRSTGEKLAAVLPVVIILLTIGMLIGSWTASGTIPALIAAGIRLIEPRFFVLSAFLVTSVMSLATGTSWGSAGTLGVALMGAGAAVGASVPATAGAILSGAYLGDKMSPLSDSTNICAIGAGADLYAHIRHMLYTATPSTILALLVYSTLGRGEATADGIPPSATELLAEIGTVFSLGFWVWVPPLVVLAGIVLKVAPALALAASSLVAMVIAVTVQGFGVGSTLLAAVSGFESTMVVDLGLDPASVGDVFRRLLDRGGLYSMAPTLVLILTAFVLAAGMDLSGALERLLAALLSRVRSTFGLIAATMSAGATMIALTSHGGVTALIVGGMFQGAYRERSLAPTNLSRSLEDSVTIVEPLMPWTVSGLFMATTLGVPTLALAPWAVFCYGGPVFSLLLAATFDRTGFGLRRLEVDAPGPPELSEPRASP
jgi:NhaC family Na+:H+ antiporter